MGKIKSWSMQMDGGLVYRPSETVSGTAVIEVEGELKVRGIFISCHGQAVTRWRKIFQKTYEDDAMGREIYINERACLLGGETTTLTAGRQTYKFSFKLPSQGIPSSFEGARGAIAYWLKLEVDKPFPSINDKFYKMFTVLAHIDINESVYKQCPRGETKKSISKALGFGDAGTLTLSASLDRTGYCPGEKISVNLMAKNESSKDLGHVKASLVQHVQYTAGTETDSITRAIRTVQGVQLGKNQTCVWEKQLLEIDAVPPSTKKLTCQIVRVTYHVLVFVEIPLGTNLELQIPIKIGTTPLGVPLSAQPRLVRPGQYQIAKSRTLNYKQCTAGLQHFSESMTDFICFKNFFPMTCYVKNNPAQAAAATRPTAAASTPPSARPTTATAAAPTAATTATKQQGTKPAVTSPPTTATVAKAPSAAPSKGTASAATTTTKPPGQPTTSPSPTVNAGAAVVPRPTPSAPPMAPGIPSEAPPSYEAACAQMSSGLPTPFYTPPEPGKGSLLLLLFPLVDVHLVSELFKRQVPNMLIHGGKIMVYTPQIEIIPSQSTAAILVHFGAQRTALSWLMNMTSNDPNLTSKWWVLVSENKVHLGAIGDLDQLKVVSLALLKRVPDFKATKEYSAEFARLVKEAIRPVKARHGGKTIMSGSTVFAGGNWTSFPAKAKEMTMTAIQFPSHEHHAAYKQEFTVDPELKKFSEMRKQIYSILFTKALDAGCPSMLQDL